MATLQAMFSIALLGGALHFFKIGKVELAYLTVVLSNLWMISSLVIFEIKDLKEKK